jgi:hypothetical protein
VAERCGRLPLALLIAGALLRSGGKAWSLQRLTDRLAPDKPGRELAGYTDETRSLAAVFGLSYRNLADDEKLLFRRLSLLPGSELDVHAASALLEADLDEADRLLERRTPCSCIASRDRSAPGTLSTQSRRREHHRASRRRLFPPAGPVPLRLLLPPWLHEPGGRGGVGSDVCALFGNHVRVGCALCWYRGREGPRWYLPVDPGGAIFVGDRPAACAQHRVLPRFAPAVPSCICDRAP